MKSLLMAGSALVALAGSVAPTMAAAQSTAAAAIATPDNILLEEWSGSFDGVPPWDQVKPAMFDEALQFSIDELLRQVDEIVANPQAATFANTIEPLEMSGQRLDRVQSIFAVMTDNLSTPEYQALDKAWSPKLSAAYDKINLNPKLFERVSAVHAARATSGLDAKQQRLVTRTYDGFVRRGAKLGADDKVKMAAINQQLASAFSDFNARLLADEGTFTTVTAAEMAGVPQDVRDAAATAAKEAGLPAGSFAVRNTRSAVEPILSFATNRGLREKVWRAFANRGDNGNANDTNALIGRIVKLRADRAHLLGFATHADWRMQDTMAKSPAKAMDLMMRVWPAAKARVAEEVRDMTALARKEGMTDAIEPWDYRFYQEKVRKERFNLSQDEIKPYFELSNLVKGMFWSAQKLYDLKFTENSGSVPVFHPDIRTFAVSNAKTNASIGLFYFDTYARTGKRSGAWATTFRSRAQLLGDNIVLGSNNNNFTKPAAGQPVLVSLDDAQTLFHEFGHAIHYYLNDVKYPSLGGSQRDFVEYPSQVNENWLLTRPVLDRFALHYQTGKPMPAALVDKIEKSQTFNEGFGTVEYLSSALVDMKLHTRPDGVVDADAFEKQALAELGMPKEMVMRHRLPQFGHLFSSDSYSAGYYSYLWSEVMDADTWAAFKDSGDVFNRGIADRFRMTLLSTGNETDRADAYRAFRGRDPDVTALLKRRGFPIK